MLGLANLLQIASSGIAAATDAMQTVANNTANVNTAGYNAESLNQIEVQSTPGGVGSGTDVTSIRRAFDQFVYQEVVSASSANQAAQVSQTNIQNLSALFPVASGGAGGLGTELDSFFTAVNTVAQDPSSVPDRESLLGAAQSLASAFNSVGSQLSTDLSGVNTQAATAVQQINSLTQQIAALNQSIMSQTGGAGSTGAASNSLLDQRDQLVQQLSQQIGVSTVRDANGAVDVYTSGGAALVNGSDATTLAVQPDQYGDGNSDIVDAANGQDLTSSISGGTLGAALASRLLISNVQDNVGGLAASFSAAINSQQSLGLDLNGNLGAPLFSVAGPTVYPSQANTGTGSLSASITDPNAFVPADFVITNTTSGFAATNTATGQVTQLGSGPNLSLDGMTIAVSGSVVVGDSFELLPTATAAQTLAVATTDPNAIAAASAYVATPGDNTGSVQASAFTTVASNGRASGAVIVPAADFGQTLSVQFTSATDFEVLSSGNAVVASGSLDANGDAQIAIAYPSSAGGDQYAVATLSGAPAAIGDSFSLTPGGVGSNGNVTALAGLSSTALLSGQTLGDAYAALVTEIGNYGNQAQVAAQSAQSVLTQAQNTQQSVSGVNLDEQAADLVTFQQAYQASAQVIATADALFQSLLNAVQAA